MPQSAVSREGNVLKSHFISLTAALCAVLLSALPAAASDPYRSYAYSTTDEGTLDVAAPQAYLPERVLTGTELGVALRSPEDLLFDGEGRLYICDTGASAIHIFSPELRLLRTVTGFKNGGAEDTFSSPYGIFVEADGTLYVADSGNGRVVVLDREGTLVRTVERPDSDLLAADFRFIPQKVLVDSSDRLFVLGKNVNEGILQFTKEGSFLGYYGSNTVVASPLTRIWKQIMTDEQTAKLTQFVPVEYRNFSLDYKGFIYAVTSVKNVGDPVRRLNLSGGDVLARTPIDGSAQVVGDVSYPYAGVTGIVGPSSFVDITSDDLGNYFILDDKRGRVFTYDDMGNLLFVFGTLSAAQRGAFASPSAITWHDGKLYATDRANAELLVFAPTEYAGLVREAMALYLRQEYTDSLVRWEEIIKCNNNCDLAYYKAGYCLYRLQRYEEAMKYFKLINAKEAYADASDKQGQLWLNDHFDRYVLWAAVAIVLLLALRSAVKRLRRRAAARNGE